MRLAITSIYTKSYAYAVRSQLAQIQKNLALCPGYSEVCYIFVTDEPRPDLETFGRSLLPDVEFINVVNETYRESQNYQGDAQRTISRMMAAAWNKALSWGADFVWNVESDVLPMPNNLRSLKSVLEFDGGYYANAFSPYVSQGGGGLLGGYGTLQRQILPDVYEDEREVPEELAQKLKEHREKAPSPASEWFDTMRELEKQLEACPPKGNIFELQSKGFRRRGWGNNAMPQAGRGMVWECDWTGTGNNLLTREAVALADFIGYERGAGTQDLHLIFRKWKPGGLRSACVSHSPCHHVIRKPFLDDEGKELSPYTIVVVSHEESDPETIGHVRHHFEPFFDFTA